MYIKQKTNLHAKCRACGNDQILDSMHRAGIQLMKKLPKNMSEIDAKKPVPQEEIKIEEPTKKKKEENLD